jgi:hypothetical protein
MSRIRFGISSANLRFGVPYSADAALTARPGKAYLSPTITKKPPSSGPMIVAIPNTAPNTPW